MSFDVSSLESIGELLAGAGIGLLIGVGIFGIALAVFAIICGWKVMQKMGMPGWYAIIPYFSSFMETRAVYGMGWWFLITLLPTVAGWIGISGFLLTIINIIVIVYGIKYAIDFSLCFGKAWYFAILVFLLPIVALAILAFGDAKYHGARVGGPLNLSLN